MKTPIKLQVTGGIASVTAGRATDRCAAGLRPSGKAGDASRSGRSGARSLFTPHLALAALSLAGFLLYRILSRYDFDQIVSSVTSVPRIRLILAAVFAAASYLCLTGFDLLATRYVGHPLPYRRVALASFVSLSLGHNIGFAALSSGAIRYRFYSRWGMAPLEVAKVILFCATTVGLGLMVLGGLALLLRPDLAQEITGLERPLIIALGLICAILAAAYLLLAATSRKSIRLGQFSLRVPRLPLAIGQIIVGPLNFACVAACLHQALAATTDMAYSGFVAVYVIANLTSLISHVPGGLGVIESVVLLLVPGANLIGGLIVFRVLYFLVPLAIGSTLFAVSELSNRRSGAASAASPISTDIGSEPRA